MSLVKLVIRKKANAVKGKEMFSSIRTSACELNTSVVSQVSVKVCSPDPVQSGTLGQEEQSSQLYYPALQNVRPVENYFVGALKACTSLKEGRLIHSDVMTFGCNSNVSISKALISLYVKCGSIIDARSVFDQSSKPDVATWNALLVGYAQVMQSQIVFQLFQQMQLEGLQPDNYTYVSILKACCRIEFLEQGKFMHASVIANGFESDVFIGSTLICLYIRGGRLLEACRVFGNLPNHNIVVWNTMICGYSEHDQSYSAFQTFQQMIQNNVKPTEATFIPILKACTKVDALYLGNVVHACIIEGAYDSHVMIVTILIGMYTKCSSLQDAQRVFEKFPERNIVTWSSMIAGYVDHGQGAEALTLFKEMLQEGISPNTVTYVSLLKACACIAARVQGMLIHSFVIIDGDLLDEILTNIIIDMYVKCGSLKDAWSIFSKLSKRTIITWSSMIEGCAAQGNGVLALQLFQQMQQEGEQPNSVMFLSMLKTCSSLGSLYEGRILQVYILWTGCDLDALVGSALIDMYAKCGSITESYRVFDRLSDKNVAIYNGMIAAYVYAGFSDVAICIFQQMLQGGFEPTNVTYASTLKACCSVEALAYGKLIHTNIIESGCITDSHVRSVLIYLYGKCGCLKDAHILFDMLQKPDVVAWNAIITGYAQQEHGEEALQLFCKMCKAAIEPDSVTFVSVLQGCISLTLEEGQLIHSEMIKCSGGVDLLTGNALLFMYVKLGSVDDASRVFVALPKHDVVSWSIMITGYAQQGNYDMVLQCLKHMQQEEVMPTDITYVSLLSACSHLGLVVDAFQHLDSMKNIHGIAPAADHYNNLVDILGRAGHLVEAEDTLQTLPYRGNLVGWTSLLGHCKTHGNVERGLDCFEQFINLDCRHASGYMLMAHLHSESGMWKDVAAVHDLRERAGAWKKPGKASIYINDKIYGFVGGNTQYPLPDAICTKLTGLKFQMKLRGYIPHLEYG